MGEKPKTEAEETIELIKETLGRVHGQGYADCRLCGRRFYGRHLGDILARLGAHGEREHGM